MEIIQGLRPLLEKPNVVLGLDAYGVMYNGETVFEPILPLLNFCSDRGIPFFMMTNNATQSIPIIIEKMEKFNIFLTPNQIISSACAAYLLPEIHEMVDRKKVYIYGYETAYEYASKANAILVEDPNESETILMMSSLNNNNHRIYKQVYDALRQDPTKNVVCLNPDHYVYYQSRYMPVMGYYAAQLEQQLGLNFHWIGKPFNAFSRLVQFVLNSHDLGPQNLVFCDDNPYNVQQMVNDLNCHGCIITDTGIYHKYKNFQNLDSKVFKLFSCKL